MQENKQANTSLALDILLWSEPKDQCETEPGLSPGLGAKEKQEL